MFQVEPIAPYWTLLRVVALGYAPELRTEVRLGLRSEAPVAAPANVGTIADIVRVSL